MTAQSRRVNMEDVLAHPMDPLPWALADADEFLRKTNKVALASEFEKNVYPTEAIPTPSACIIHVMGVVQRMNGNNKTRAHLAESVLSIVMCVVGHGGRVDVVFDVYRQPPFKYSESLNQGTSTTILYKCLTVGYNIQHWRKFMCSPFNKTSLGKFLVGEWKLLRYRYMLQSKALYMTCEDICEETCLIMTANEWVEVAVLQTTQEEAYTRLLLHALHAARSGSKAVIVTADDTDVMMISKGPIYQ